MKPAPEAEDTTGQAQQRWETIWETLQMDPDVEADTLLMDGGETLVPPDLRQSREIGVLVDELPKLTASRQNEGELRVTATLGQGGMGVVYLARQTTIGREVAVKTIREDRRSTIASRELLREAWITGRLEHPNIIPVHSLGIDEQGCPLFVMKRVEGVSWADTKFCNRATHVDPAQRFESAEAFRQALADFRRHRSSRQIVRDLEETLSALEACAGRDEISTADASMAHGLFGTCRFWLRASAAYLE